MTTVMMLRLATYRMLVDQVSAFHRYRLKRIEVFGWSPKIEPHHAAAIDCDTTVALRIPIIWC